MVSWGRENSEESENWKAVHAESKLGIKYGIPVIYGGRLLAEDLQNKLSNKWAVGMRIEFTELKLIRWPSFSYGV